MDRIFIENYASGGEKLASAITGLSAGQLNKAPPEGSPREVGKWSIHHVVIHLADAELAFADRIRRIIAEDDPVLLAWDHDRFAERLAYDAQSADDAIALITLTRRQTARTLRTLPDAAFERAGKHSQRGRQTLADVLKMADWHLDHHTNFIVEKRKRLIAGS